MSKVQVPAGIDDGDADSPWVDDRGNDSDSSLDSVSSNTSLASNYVIHGATSLFEPINVLNRTVAGEEEKQEQHESPEASQASSQSQIAWVSLTRQGNIGIKTLERETRMNNQAALRRSVDLYFTHLNPHHPSLNENEFRAQMESFFADSPAKLPMPSGDRYQFAVLLNLLHAEAEILGGHCDESSSIPAWDVFCRAESTLNRIVWLGNGNIWTVQCLLVKARYLLYMERSDSAYDTIGQAVRLCIQLGLHNQDNWKSYSPFGIVMRQRLFWSVYYLERDLAVNSGTPYLLRDSDFNVDLPPDLDDHMMFPGKPLPEEMPMQSSSPYLRAIAQWGKLSDEVWDKIFGLHAQKPTNRELVATIDARILYVASELPPHLQLPGPASHLDALNEAPAFIPNQALTTNLVSHRIFFPHCND